MIIEIHSHTAEHSSCSRVAAADLIQHCVNRDLHGLVLTDHHYLWLPNELDALVKRSGAPPHFIVLSGQEVRTSDFGDVLVYGADAGIAQGATTTEISRRFPAAALVLAHPYRNGKIPAAQVLMDPVLHAIEIFNANQTILENVRGLQDWHRHRFTAVGGTDIHSMNGCGTYPTVLDHPIDSVEALAREIRAGRCRPLLDEIPHSGTSHRRVTELRLGRSCAENGDERLILKAHQNSADWKSGERTQKIMEAIAEHGFNKGIFRVPVPLGGDENSLVRIEEGVKGGSLFRHLIQAQNGHMEELLTLAARWLAALHRLNLKITPAGEFLELEAGRIERYLSILSTTRNSHTERIRQIADKVMAYEFRWFKDRPDLLSQGHGDFHPKNILVSHDNAAGTAERFVAAVDFHSSYQLPQAYDAGTFLAQYENQLRAFPNILQHAPPGVFVDAYAAASERVPTHFRTQVELFKARTALSIIHYLVKVGLGESDNLREVILSAEKSLILVEAEQSMFPSKHF